MACRNEIFSVSSTAPLCKNTIRRRAIGLAIAVIASSVSWGTASAVGEDARRLASEVPAPSLDPSSDQAELALTRELADYAKWKSARACANGSSGCAALRCYDDYLATASPPRAHVEEARSARARLLQGCPAAVAAASPVATLPVVPADERDGRYLARSHGGCGTKPSSVTLTIVGATIFWRHELQGNAYEWRGAIDANGHIAASVGSAAAFQANGRYSGLDREMTMKYPQCDAEISMSIISKLAN